MRNQYGAELRELITSAFAVDVVLEMHMADAFHDEVDAYRTSILADSVWHLFSRDPCSYRSSIELPVEHLRNATARCLSPEL
jgi:hypothetical protein